MTSFVLLKKQNEDVFTLLRNRAISLKENVLLTEYVVYIKTPPTFTKNIIYNNVLKRLSAKKDALKTTYEQSSTKDSIISVASETFTTYLFDSIIPYWYGTPWDFNGIAEFPDDDKPIACGYFVSTPLKQAGIHVNRYKLAQQAAETIVLKLVDENYIIRYRNIAFEDFLADIKSKGKAVYVIGLDNHVGFIKAEKDAIYFVHSSYVDCQCVVKEDAYHSYILKGSSYRIIGQLSNNKDF